MLRRRKGSYRLPRWNCWLNFSVITFFFAIIRLSLIFCTFIWRPYSFSLFLSRTFFSTADHSAFKTLYFFLWVYKCPKSFPFLFLLLPASFCYSRYISSICITNSWWTRYLWRVHRFYWIIHLLWGWCGWNIIFSWGQRRRNRVFFIGGRGGCFAVVTV